MRHIPKSIYDKSYIVMTTLPSGLNVYGAGTDNESNYRFTGSAQEAERQTYYDAVNDAYCREMNENLHLFNRNAKIAARLKWEPVKV